MSVGSLKMSIISKVSRLNILLLILSLYNITYETVPMKIKDYNEIYALNDKFYIYNVNYL